MASKKEQTYLVAFPTLFRAEEVEATSFEEARDIACCEAETEEGFTTHEAATGPPYERRCYVSLLGKDKKVVETKLYYQKPVWVEE